jgi:hypothetical protein
LRGHDCLQDWYWTDDGRQMTCYTWRYGNVAVFRPVPWSEDSLPIYLDHQPEKARAEKNGDHQTV